MTQRLARSAHPSWPRQFTLFLCLLLVATVVSGKPRPEWKPLGDPGLEAYFAEEVEKIESQTFRDIETLSDWETNRSKYRSQLFEMLGLSPDRERTPLQAETTGITQADDFTLEKIHFQSSPGLYVTGNLYLPHRVTDPAPAILYVCGHGPTKIDGISFGNKVSYQHHGAWFARNGYVCLVIDTVQMGEIEGIHHGTYREDMWWWNSRGYTSAGAEAWNCIRALDYLQSRPEVDGERIGVTGRSGGGAYSWWISALDDRIKAAVPVAGIADLRNHVVDGCVEGHCDCMFMVNTYRWDYAQIAALIAPRPLLISNTDKDAIFPLDGVVRVHRSVSRIYDFYGAEEKLGLVITEGPHKDSQQLRVPAFHWFNRWLKGEQPNIAMTAESFFKPQELKVFDNLPADEITSTIYETFTPKAPLPSPPNNSEQWSALRDRLVSTLTSKSFAGWPTASRPLELDLAFNVEKNGITFSAFDFTSQNHVTLRLYLMQKNAEQTRNRITLRVLDRNSWNEWVSAMSVSYSQTLESENYENLAPNEDAYLALKRRILSGQILAFLAPRGIGLSDWRRGFNDHQTIAKKEIQIRRRYMQIGQTLDGMRVWDIQRGIQVIRNLDELGWAPLTIASTGDMAVNVLYATIFEPNIEQLVLTAMPASHRDGPDYLNILKTLDIPTAVALAAEKSKVRLIQSDPEDWIFPSTVSKNLNWKEEQFSVEEGVR